MRLQSAPDPLDNRPEADSPAGAANPQPPLMADEASRLRMAMLALENIGEGIYWLDIDGRMLDVNPVAERELDYTANELQRMRVSDIDPNVPPEVWGKDVRNLAPMRFAASPMVAAIGGAAREIDDA